MQVNQQYNVLLKLCIKYIVDIHNSKCIVFTKAIEYVIAIKYI